MKKTSKKQLKQRFHNNLLYRFVVAPSGIQGAGNGLFVDENIPKDTLIGTYECHWNFMPKTASSYSFYINRRICLDIDMSDMPYSALLNDTWETDFHTNVVARYILDDDQLERLTKKEALKLDPSTIVELYTTDKIEKGDELFFSYGRSYWKEW